jgi:hypothetical protein
MEQDEDGVYGSVNPSAANGDSEQGETTAPGDDSSGESGAGNIELPPFSPPSEATAADASTDVTMLPFDFCFYAAGRPWGQLTIYAPSPDLAQLTANQTAQLLTQSLHSMGYNVTVSASPGPCP